jgi:hypothetical protein
MEPMTDDLKKTIIREHLDIWLVLAEEFPPDLTADDLPSGKNQAKVRPFLLPSTVDPVR